MHASSLENMYKCYRKYIARGVLESRSPLRVLDVGGANVNGTYADVFSGANVEYLGADIAAGEGVEIVLNDPYTLPLDDGSIDIVVSGQMLEHCECFWVVFAEMVRVVKDDGFIFLIAPSAGPIHRYPVDCYRFYPDAYHALAKHAGCHLLEVWHDNRGPWNDLVGVFNKSGVAPQLPAVADISGALAVNAQANTPETTYERIQGEVPYLDVLRTLHEVIQPSHYLEIGVRHGRSLSLARCDAVGVDPAPDVQVDLPPTTRLVRQTSDEFFEQAADPILRQQPELVFIDGMHLFEYALRDFMNVERFSGSNTVVGVDDVFPNEPQQATRGRNTRVWCGDVWKLYWCLRAHRPDLMLIPLNTSPTGLLLIAGLDRSNRQLWDAYNPVVREALHTIGEPGPDILTRESAISPSHSTFTQWLEGRRAVSHGNTPVPASDVKSPTPVPPTSVRTGPKLSVVVISYNMTRELPRTLRTLSPAMQSGLDVADYEVIVVDNGSTELFDRAACDAIAPNLRILDETSGSPSPVAAVNKGLAAARGELIGVMIDGARMASPGLLRAAWDADQTDSNTIVGTLAFHLGKAVQMESVKHGYDQAVEDALLASVPWESDGYRLFDISVFAGSSQGGWFVTPAETNALFMRRPLWNALGGFDERFQSPGGGLANLDAWYRACQLPEGQVAMLLGEATFHQVHGGVATNSPISHREAYDAEYQSIRGHSYEVPRPDVVFYGRLRPNHMPTILQSAQALLDV